MKKLQQGLGRLPTLLDYHFYYDIYYICIYMLAPEPEFSLSPSTRTQTEGFA